jgi:isocitrate lyase
MDSMDFGSIYEFSAIDIVTRQVGIIPDPETRAEYGARSLFKNMKRSRRHVDPIHTDGGSEIKADFSTNVHVLCCRVSGAYRRDTQSYMMDISRYRVTTG